MPSRLSANSLSAAFAAIAITFLGVVYVADAGHGFLKDDFAWIRSSAPFAHHPWTALHADAAGTFFRPVVTVSFAIDHAIHGLTADGYAATNLALLILCAMLIAGIFTSLGVTITAAGAGATAWLMNPHGINMSLLWISGRTSLLMALFSCAAILSATRRRGVASVLFLFVALLSKEDAIAVPVIMLAAMWITGQERRRLVLVGTGCVAAIAVYLLLRAESHALTAASAPSYYQLTWSPHLIIANAFAYLDRSGTFMTVIAVITLALSRARLVFSPRARQLLALAAIWFIAGVLVTVRVPVRSSLYAVFPSIGLALALSVVVDMARQEARAFSGAAVTAALLAILLLAAPLYRARNVRWVKPADISRQAMDQLAHVPWPQNGRIAFEHEPVRFGNFEDAFGEAVTDAVRLGTGLPLDGVIVAPGERADDPAEVGRFTVVDGDVRRAR